MFRDRGQEPGAERAGDPPSLEAEALETPASSILPQAGSPSCLLAFGTHEPFLLTVIVGYSRNVQRPAVWGQAGPWYPCPDPQGHKMGSVQTVLMIAQGW